MTTTKYYKSMVLNYGISHFYSFMMDEIKDDAMMAVPDGCIDILFCCDSHSPSAKVCGTVLQPSYTFARKNCYYFGVRFLPGHIPCLCHVNMAEVLAQEIPLEALLKDKDMFYKIVESRDFAYQQKVFLKTYLKHYAPYTAFNVKNNLHNFIVNRMVSTAGNISIQELSQETGYTQRYINQTFRLSYGMSPKIFCRMMRFQYLLDNLGLETDFIDYADLAVAAGYYDQPHMVKEFKAFSMNTPKKYLNELRKENYSGRLIIL